MIWDDTRARAALRTLFDAAVAAADPRKVLAAHLPAKPTGRCIVVGGGKSAAVMAAALEDAWPDVDLTGTVVTRYGHAVPTRHIEVIEAAHPVPDVNSERGARRLLERVHGLGPDDLVLALISGGGSALCAAPAPGLTLADKQEINRALLASGANITEMNCVRKHLSAIKGGRLAAAAAPARVVTLAISDVPGDDPAVIASGPTVPDPHHLRRRTCASSRATASRPSPAAAAPPRQRDRRDPEARRPAQQRLPPDRHADHRRCTRWRTPRARLGPDPADPGRRAGRRGGAGRYPVRRHRPLRRHARPAAGSARRAADRRRDHTVTHRRAVPPDAVAATPSSCCRSPSPSGPSGGTPRGSGPPPATPTASTAPRTPPAPSSPPTPWPARVPRAGSARRADRP